MRVLLVAGGWSNEREVSLAGARQIHQALQRLGHAVELYDPSQDLSGLLQKAADHDFAFINLHGDPGEDGLIQALLDTIGCPYQGSGPAGSLRALDKAAAKEIFAANGLPTPAWKFLPRLPAKDWECPLSLPVFVKPNTGGSSLGMSRIDSPEALWPALSTCFAEHSQVLLEEFLPGVEVTCAVLGTDPLPPVLIRPTGSQFFDYTSKYTPGGAEELCPAPIGNELTHTIQAYALKAHALLGLADYSRTDFILVEDNPFLLEVNTLPGMTQTSLLPQSAKEAGYSFEELIARLLQLGLASSAR